MALVVLLAIYPLVLRTQLTRAPLLTDWPMLLRTLTTSAVLVSLTKNAVTPPRTRLFARWLYGHPRE